MVCRFDTVEVLCERCLYLARPYVLSCEHGVLRLYPSLVLLFLCALRGFLSVGGLCLFRSACCA